jgi:hypothetical protein
VFIVWLPSFISGVCQPSPRAKGAVFRCRFFGPSPSFFFPLDFFCHWQAVAKLTEVFLLTSQRLSVRLAQ